jgi:hypothetical protein
MSEQEKTEVYLMYENAKPITAILQFKGGHTEFLEQDVYPVNGICNIPIDTSFNELAKNELYYFLDCKGNIIRSTNHDSKIVFVIERSFFFDFAVNFNKVREDLTRLMNELKQKEGQSNRYVYILGMTKNMCLDVIKHFKNQ